MFSAIADTTSTIDSTVFMSANETVNASALNRFASIYFIMVDLGYVL